MSISDIREKLLRYRTELEGMMAECIAAWQTGKDQPFSTEEIESVCDKINSLIKKINRVK